MTPLGTSGAGSRRVALLLAGAALALGACGRSEVARFHRFTELPYRARPEASQVLPGSPRDLSDEGYVLLGHIEVRQPVRECENTRCREYTHERSPRDTAVDLAAKHGGDVILLGKDNVLEREVSEREGRCKVPNAPSPLRPRRPGFVNDDCAVYEAVAYVRELRVAEGYVWRHEPEHVSARSRALWRRWFHPDEPSPAPAGTETSARSGSEQPTPAATETPPSPPNSER